MGIIPTVDELALYRFDASLRDSVEQIRRAFAGVGDAGSASDVAPGLGDLPSSQETRELLGLFARLQSEELRRAVLGLMRSIVGTPL